MTDDLQHFDPTIRSSTLLRENMIIRDFAAGEMIIIEKDSTAHVYFILSGKVKVTSFHSNGKEVWHAALTPGYTFGEMAAISGAQRSATVITSEPSRIGILPKAPFLRALETQPGLSLYFLKDMVSRLQSTTLYSNERIALDIPARICAELLRQAGETPTPNGYYLVDRALNVTTLAQRIHANRETVSRTISTLITKGMITKQGRQFIIMDKAAVARRAEGE